MWDHMGEYGGWWGLGFVFMLFFWALVIVAIAALLKWLLGGTSRGEVRDGSRRAIEILDERYAQGDIEREEYLRRKADLHENAD